MIKKHNKAKFAKGAALGIALGAVVAGTAALLFAPKSGKELRGDIKKATNDVSKRVLSEVEKTKNMSQKKYHEIIDKVVNEYVKNKKVATSAVVMLKKDLKGKWKEVEREIKDVAAPAKKTVKKVATKAKAKIKK